MDATSSVTFLVYTDLSWPFKDAKLMEGQSLASEKEPRMPQSVTEQSGFLAMFD